MVDDNNVIQQKLTKMILRKLTKEDEHLKLNGLINDKEVNEAIEERWLQFRKEFSNRLSHDKRIMSYLMDSNLSAEAIEDLKIMNERNNK